jgi:hypothetical protein
MTPNSSEKPAPAVSSTALKNQMGLPVIPHAEHLSVEERQGYDSPLDASAWLQESHSPRQGRGGSSTRRQEAPGSPRGERTSGETGAVLERQLLLARADENGGERVSARAILIVTLVIVAGGLVAAGVFGVREMRDYWTDRFDAVQGQIQQLQVKGAEREKAFLAATQKTEQHLARTEQENRVLQEKLARTASQLNATGATLQELQAEKVKIEARYRRLTADLSLTGLVRNVNRWFGQRLSASSTSGMEVSGPAGPEPASEPTP